MTWEAFRERFLDECAGGRRFMTRQNYEDTFVLFEKLCKPGSMKAISVRTISAFASTMRQLPTRGQPGMMANTIKVRRLGCG